MEETLSVERITAEQDLKIDEAIRSEHSRLRNFIRQRVSDDSDAEDILQEVFYELVEAYRLMKPIERVGAWVFRVARNQITDLFRKKKPDAFLSDPAMTGDGEPLLLEDLIPSPHEGPEEAFARGVLLEELNAALEDLPEAQRAVFVAHEIEGRSFKDLAEETGVSVNTLLSRKRYAVRHLRSRLQAIYDEVMKEEGK